MESESAHTDLLKDDFSTIFGKPFSKEDLKYQHVRLELGVDNEINVKPIVRD